MDISRYRNVGLLNAEAYAQNFINKDTGNVDSQYALKARTTREESLRIAGISGSPTSWDTADEITLLSATIGVINSRPIEAAKMLPADDPVLLDLQLGAMLYMKKAAVNFLGNGDPAKYATELKFITDKGNVTEADIKNFMAQGIAATVDAEFNKIKFSIDRTNGDIYGTVLTRNAQNHYVLSYEGYFNGTQSTRTLPPASSLEALSSAMSNSGDFSAVAFNVVHKQAALIPAVALAQTGTTDAVLGTVKKALTDFYVSPTTANYNTVKDIYALFMRRAWEYHQDPLFEIITSSYSSALGKISIPLANKVRSEANQEKYAASTLTQTQIRDLEVRR